jgi:hypothetical protein
VSRYRRLRVSILTIDPFSSEQVEAGRLPKVVDDWLNDQILAGESVESIRRKLDMRPDTKQEVSFCVFCLEGRRLNVI